MVAVWHFGAAFALGAASYLDLNTVGEVWRLVVVFVQEAFGLVRNTAGEDSHSAYFSEKMSPCLTRYTAEKESYLKELFANREELYLVLSIGVGPSS